MHSRKCSLGILITSLLVAGCQSQSNLSEEVSQLSLPASWQHVETSAFVDDWGLALDEPVLTSLITQGLTSSYQLKSQYQQLEFQRLALDIADTQLMPLINLSLGQNRRKTSDESYNANANLDVNLSYEVDIWGRLSASQQQSALQYAASQQTYHRQKQQLIGDISRAWFNLIESHLLLTLYQQRVENLQKNHETINRSYKLGLADALDIYLSQNNLLQETARVSQQVQNKNKLSHQLNLLLGKNPIHEFELPQSMPAVPSVAATGLPSELLSRRLDIKSRWLGLLAQDKAVAVAHKQRFPKLSLSLSSGLSGENVGKLSDSGVLWSIAANLVGPLFDAGRLARLEEQAKSKLIQAEQEYLQAVWSAMSEVELLLADADSLAKRKSILLQSEKNAIAAEKLAFNQYQKGLVNYNTVLESQRRAFDAKTAIIQINNQSVQNRISLNIALGGDFESALTHSTVPSKS